MIRDPQMIATLFTGLRDQASGWSIASLQECRVRRAIALLLLSKRPALPPQHTPGVKASFPFSAFFLYFLALTGQYE